MKFLYIQVRHLDCHVGGRAAKWSLAAKRRRDRSDYFFVFPLAAGMRLGQANSLQPNQPIYEIVITKIFLLRFFNANFGIMGLL